MKQDLTFSRVDQMHDRPTHSRFARTALANKTQRLSRTHAERDAVDRLHRANTALDYESA